MSTKHMQIHLLKYIEIRRKLNQETMTEHQVQGELINHEFLLYTL